MSDIPLPLELVTLPLYVNKLGVIYDAHGQFVLPHEGFWHAWPNEDERDAVRNYFVAAANAYPELVRFVSRFCQHASGVKYSSPEEIKDWLRKAEQMVTAAAAVGVRP